MTIKEIKEIAIRHGVPSIFLRGNTKESLLWKIDSYYDGLYDHMIILGDVPAKLGFEQKRDNLRAELGISDQGVALKLKT